MCNRYAHPKIIAMVKTGAMRLPINKAHALADALKVPRLDVLGALLIDQSPELWSVISELLPVGELTHTEVNLVRHLRRLTEGRTASPMVLDGAGLIALVVA